MEDNQRQSRQYSSARSYNSYEYNNYQLQSDTQRPNRHQYQISYPPPYVRSHHPAYLSQQDDSSRQYYGLWSDRNMGISNSNNPAYNQYSNAPKDSQDRLDASNSYRYVQSNQRVSQPSYRVERNDGQHHGAPSRHYTYRSHPNGYQSQSNDGYHNFANTMGTQLQNWQKDSNDASARQSVSQSSHKAKRNDISFKSLASKPRQLNYVNSDSSKITNDAIENAVMGLLQLKGNVKPIGTKRRRIDLDRVKMFEDDASFNSFLEMRKQMLARGDSQVSENRIIITKLISQLFAEDWDVLKRRSFEQQIDLALANIMDEKTSVKPCGRLIREFFLAKFSIALGKRIPDDFSWHDFGPLIEIHNWPIRGPVWTRDMVFNIIQNLDQIKVFPKK